MKRHALHVLSAAVVFGLVTAGPLGAQDTTKTKPDTTRKESKGDVAAAPSFATLMTAMNAIATMTMKVDSLTALTAEQITFVDAETLIADGNEKELNAAVQTQEREIDSLRKTLQKNQVFAKALAEHPAKVELDHLLAADVTEGKLTVYYRKQKS